MNVFKKSLKVVKDEDSDREKVKNTDKVISSKIYIGMNELYNRTDNDTAREIICNRMIRIKELLDSGEFDEYMKVIDEYKKIREAELERKKENENQSYKIITELYEAK